MPDRLRLMVIDDNPLDRALILRELENEIRDVRSATICDQAEFEAMLKGPEPDVIITDHSLGWTSGLIVLQECKRKWPYCPIIMFTGTGGEEIAVEGMKGGLDDYIIKAPQQYFKLRRAVARSLHLAEAKRAAARLKIEREELLAREVELRKAAEEASRLKDEFLATVSHELRTPLTPILGWIRILRDRKLNDPTLDRALDVIERNVTAQAHIIEDLLDMSAIIAGKLKLSLKPIDLPQLVRGAVASILPTAELKNISIKVQTTPIAPGLLGDPVRLQQALWNLLTNAIKFTARGGQVDVAVAPHESGAAVSVADNGEGIDPAFLPYLFQRFSQADSSTTRRYGGLGLGLAIVRHIIELHGGSVSVESAGKGQGSRFMLLLPVRDAAAVPAPARPESRSDPRILNQAALLVVEDDTDTRELLQASLEKYGADCAAAASAKEALVKIEEKPPMLVLSDIGMQEHDGHWLVKQIKQRHPDLPVIALTAYARDADEAAALKSGFDRFVTKPVDIESLAQLIADVLAR